MALLETVEINCDERIAAAAVAASDSSESSQWLRVINDISHKCFFWNAATNETSWRKPPALVRGGVFCRRLRG